MKGEAGSNVRLFKMLELVATLGTLTGFYLIEENKKQGFYISAFSNILWVIWGIDIAGIPFFVLQCILFIISIKGIIKYG